MAEEPQPSTIKEGVSDPHAPTSTAEDRKAAAALSNLDAQDDDSSKKDVNSQALGEAMKNLSVGEKSSSASTVVKKEAEKKVVKVDATDVALLVRPSEMKVLDVGYTTDCEIQNGQTVHDACAYAKTQVSELELPKPKATELLRAHEGDVVKAMAAFVSASA